MIVVGLICIGLLSVWVIGEVCIVLWMSMCCVCDSGIMKCRVMLKLVLILWCLRVMFIV